MELEPLELALLNTTLFPEKFESIRSENKFTQDPYLVADGLKNLLKNRLIRPVHSDGKASLVYDSDHMDDYLYEATQKGIAVLELYSDRC